MKIQQVRGTRDFYPEDMAIRVWIADGWRRASKLAGFQEVDGPCLELLELFTEKSGPEIAGQLYTLKDKGGRDLALRPEFTPTLARMVGRRMASLGLPIKWFNISRFFRYERPQKGRGREFFQWNIDILGSPHMLADAECISVAVDFLCDVGLTAEDVQVRISDRKLLSAIMTHLGIPEAMLPAVFSILDKRDKLGAEGTSKAMAEVTRDKKLTDNVLRLIEAKSLDELEKQFPSEEVRAAAGELRTLFEHLRAFGIADFCKFDVAIVRGLDYYTGVVWEAWDRKGKLRALFGGGRYDRLLKDLGAGDLPACGFGAGDMTIRLLLESRGMLPATEAPCEYFVAVADESVRGEALRKVSQLRRSGLSTMFDIRKSSLKKQLSRAGDLGVRYCVIFDDKFKNDNTVVLKDMRSGEQKRVKPAEVC